MCAAEPFCTQTTPFIAPQQFNTLAAVGKSAEPNGLISTYSPFTTLSHPEPQSVILLARLAIHKFAAFRFSRLQASGLVCIQSQKLSSQFQTAFLSAACRATGSVGVGWCLLPRGLVLTAPPIAPHGPCATAARK
uniref:Uncharacterized protein n=1 Tax=Eutreptiella gymnastica TaxID=73025 RepID=A0A7S1IAI7_9EUGL